MGCPLDTGNLGVSALGASLVALIQQSDPDIAVEMLLGRRTSDPYVYESGGRVVEVRVSNFRLSPGAGVRQNLFVWFALALLYRALPLASWQAFLRQRHPLIRLTAEADFVGDIRGGDSFSDIYGLKGFLLGSLQAVCVLLAGGRLVLLPQTYGPFKSHVARRVAGYLLRRSSLILSRDRESIAAVSKLIGDTSRCRLCPDVAFSLETHAPRALTIDPPLPGNTDDKLIGVNINAYLYYRSQQRRDALGLRLDYPAFAVRLVEQLLANEHHRVLLVGHTISSRENSDFDDRVACRNVRDRLPPALRHRAHVTDGKYDQGEIKAVIGQCTFLVGSRMHACIAALSQGIPAVGVAYSKKFAGVFDTVGAGGWVIDGRTADENEAIAKTLELFHSRDGFRPELTRRVQAVRAHHREVFADLVR